MRSGSQRRWSLLIVALVVALLGAPGLPLLGNACDHCPPQCPMHANAKMRCHGAAAGMAHGGHCRNAVGISLPGCGHPSQPTGIGLVRAVLPQSTVGWFVPAGALARLSPLSLHVRNADPPESPPPIVIS